MKDSMVGRRRACWCVALVRPGKRNCRPDGGGRSKKALKAESEHRMIIGVPNETKCDEFRVGLLPVGAEELTRSGHKVLIESGAGLGSGLPDAEYAKHEAEIVGSAAELYSRAEMVVKVKEPQPAEYPLLRPGQTVFTYFHFAANRRLTEAVLRSGITAVAYETLRDGHGRLPLLTPMSEVAGRMSIQQGAKYLERPQMGRGILLGGVPGVEPANVTILGGGIVGYNAAKIAAGVRARVTILDVDLDRLRYLDDIMPANVEVLFSDRQTIHRKLPDTDLLVGAVLIPGARAPRLLEREDLRLMKPGSVIVDVAIDQGGCAATSRCTTHSEPVYVVDEVLHYCVANIPGAVGRTSTFALCNVTLPWVLRLARRGVLDAANAWRPLASAINIHQGKVTNRMVAETFDLPFSACFDEAA
jgi:alanine dehydrogenase